jgi:hypothetical protein
MHIRQKLEGETFCLNKKFIKFFSWPSIKFSESHSKNRVGLVTGNRGMPLDLGVTVVCMASLMTPDMSAES